MAVSVVFTVHTSTVRFCGCSSQLKLYVSYLLGRNNKVAAAASHAADRHGMSFSAWLNAAAASALVLEEGLAVVRAWEAEHGALSHEELTSADAVLDGECASLSALAMAGITYETGVLIAAERGHRRVWALHRRSLERGMVPTVPAGVLAQSWRGGPQHQMSRLLSQPRSLQDQSPTLETPQPPPIGRHHSGH